MTNKQGIFLFVCLLLLAVAALTTLVTDPPTEVVLQMVDSVGHPIAGVVVTPDGLRPKSDSSSRGGHFGWTEKSHDVKPTPLISDANGRIRLRFPRYVHDRVETGEVSFEVDHPDYCFERPFRAVSAAPSRSGGLKARLKFGLFQLLPRGRFTPEPVVLQSGAVVRVSAKNAGGEPLTDFVVQLPGLSWLNSSNDWRTVAPGVKESRRVPAGPRTLRVVQPGGTRPAGFAEPVRFAVTTVGTNSFTCSVLPGLRVTGRLDSAVPRPVANGRVVVEVISGGASRPEDRIVWHTWTKVSAGGEFTFESLPAGEAEFVGICDGWVSVNGTHVSRPGGSVVPQLIALPLATGHLVLPMEPAGALEVRVLDNLGRPLARAEVHTWPNAVWGGFGRRILGGDLFDTSAFFDGSAPVRHALWSQRNPDYLQLTDATGTAMLRNIPVGSQACFAKHGEFEMSVKRGPFGSHREERVQILPGSTNRITIRMNPAGTEPER